MSRNRRDQLSVREERRRRQPYRPVVLFLEDRVLPGDGLLGALAAHGLLAPRELSRQTLGRSENVPALAMLSSRAASVNPTPEIVSSSSVRSADPARIVLPPTPTSTAASGLTFTADTLAFSFPRDPLQCHAAFEAAATPRASFSAEQAGLTAAPDLGGTGGSNLSATRPATPVMAPAATVSDPYAWVFGIHDGGPSIQAPNAPVIIDPIRDGATVSTAVHLETQPFSDPNPLATHYASEWELRRNEPGDERIWSRRATVKDGDPSLLLHIHLGDGTFEGSHQGQTLLRPSNNYRLRVRFQNNFNEFSPWSERPFVTQNQLPGDPDRRWAARQAGYQVEQVASDFKLPVNIAFVPNPSYRPGTPLYYVTELYGEVKVVTADGHVRTYAGADAQDPLQRPNSLLNFNPTGQFPGSGEQGVTGIAVHPTTGDVYISTVWSINSSVDAAPHYGRVLRLESDDGGLSAARRVVVLDTACRLTWQVGDPACGEEQGQSHQISNVSFGPDGYLYVNNGEGFDAARAQNLDRFGGKVLRLDVNGLPPTDNPHYVANCTHPVTGRPCPRNYVYTRGLRNPFGGDWWARNNRHYVVENGPGTNDRFSETVAGRNYLWDGSDASMTNFAIYNWAPPQAPVNLAFIQPERFGGSRFPQAKWDHAFVSNSGPTYGQGPQQNGKRIQEFVLNPETGQLVAGPTPLVEYTGTGRATITALAAGPDGLYFADLYRDDGVGGPTARGANVYRVRYGTVDFAADAQVSCAAPLTVRFSDRSTVSDPVYWFWNFGDGNYSLEQNPTYTYAQPGVYEVTLSVWDIFGAERTLRRPAYIGAGRVGLRAEAYPFTNIDQVYQYAGQRYSRIDPTVNFDLTTGLPFTEIGNNNFYVRWTGQVRSLDAGTYNFSTVSDDGVRLWVNNQLIINNWTLHGPTTDNGTIQLAANQDYDIRMDFFQAGGGAEARLRWTPPNQAQQVIPTTQLCPTMTSTALTPPNNLRANAVSQDSIQLAWQNNTNLQTSLVVERSPNGQQFTPLVGVELIPNAARFTDRPPQAGTWYYRVRISNTLGSVVSDVLAVPFRQPLDFSGGFGNPAGLTRNGSAVFTGNVAQITTGANDQAGSFFADARVGIVEFTNVFTFQIRPGTAPMADGMAFVIQGNSPTALGPSGGGLGYGPDQPGCCGITNSVAIKFDIYQNATEGTNSTGLFTDGASPTVPRTGSGDVLVNLAGSGIDLTSQHVFLVTMTYRGTTLNVRILSLTTLIFAEQNYTVNIAAKVGGTSAHVGFTGGTGGLTAIQEVRTWRFVSLAP